MKSCFPVSMCSCKENKLEKYIRIPILKKLPLLSVSWAPPTFRKISSYMYYAKIRSHVNTDVQNVQFRAQKIYQKVLKTKHANNKR